MTEEQQIKWLSDSCEDLKVKLWECRNGINNRGIMKQHEILEDKFKQRGIRIQEQANEIVELKKEVNRLKQQLKTAQEYVELHNEAEVVELSKDSEALKTGKYVQARKYMKVKGTVAELADKVRRLTEELNKQKQEI